MNYINLINVNLIDDLATFEFLFKAKEIKEDTKIYLENQNVDLFYGKITKAPNPITYTYFDNEEVEVCKVLIEVKLGKLGKFEVKVWWRSSTKFRDIK